MKSNSQKVEKIEQRIVARTAQISYDKSNYGLYSVIHVVIFSAFSTV